MNHIRHHTYFKSSYVHIQVFHILHHHTMKLLLAFKSFMPRRLIVEIGSENWFAAGCPIRQRKLFRCWRHIFGSESQFRCSQLNFDSESQVRCRTRHSTANCYMRCRRHSFGSESPFAAKHNSAANVNSLQPTQFRQRITVSLHNPQFGSEC